MLFIRSLVGSERERVIDSNLSSFSSLRQCILAISIMTIDAYQNNEILLNERPMWKILMQVR